METIAVDASTGLIGVSSLIKAAMPGLHDSTVRRSIQRALTDYTGPKPTPLNGMAKFGTFEMCLYMLDNLTGAVWENWRENSGQAFKAALSKRVEDVRAAISEQEHIGEVVEEIETKASMLQKSLRSMNITGYVRIDETTAKASIIDVIRMLCPGINANNAAFMFSRVIEQSKDHAPPIEVHAPPINRSLSEGVDHVKINGKGHTTPVSDAKTIVEIIWLLPVRAAKEFRRQSAETICRVLGGDVGLCQEIEERCARLQSTDEGRTTQAFLLHGREEAVDSFDGMSAGFKYLTEKDKGEIAKRMIEQQLSVREQELCERRVALKRKTCDDMIETYTKIKVLGVKLDGRTLVEIRDNVFTMTRQDLVVDRAVAVATPLSSDTNAPTHELDAARRGGETGIVVVSAKIGIRVPPNMSGTVGKRMKALYKAKYSLPAEWNNFVKRQTLLNGRPIQENVYYERDEDIIQEAIRAIVTP